MKTAALAILVSALIGGAAQARFVQHKERHLGPTGMFGVTSPTEIKITKVAEGSPAEGKVKEGDVIVRAGGIAFKDETRKQFAEAIDRAESEKGKGVLSLELKDGRKVDLQLEVLGSYSESAPFNCKKTDALITRAAEAIIAKEKYGRGDMNIGLLGLLATGEEKYVNHVRDVIHAAAWAKPDIKLGLETYARTAWSWGYLNVLLAEYYLLTGDEYVLPALRAYSEAIAKGRDAAGLWGHGMATYDLNRGQPHGRLPGYAVMNQSSLPCFLSLLLASKAGIEHPEIAAGIEQTHGFYTDFIGRGTLPYGVHEPNSGSFNNNGMSGLAAVAFSLKGNKEGARFFSQMSAASHNTLETGHTGHFFNQMWTAPGAHVAGPEVVKDFDRESRWLRTMNRSWDGDFTYDCSGYPNAIFSYRGLSDAGAHLVNLCLGRRKLYITGRDADPTLWLNDSAAADVIALGNLDLAAMSDEELLGLFGHPMPKLRREAIWTLRSREHELTPRITAMIGEGSKDQRMSAVNYFGYGCPKDVALPVKGRIAGLLCNPKEDTELRSRAAAALAAMGEEAREHYQDVVALLIIDKPEDPRGLIDMDLGRSLSMFSADPIKDGLVDDPDVFYAGVGKLLDHKLAGARDFGMKMIVGIPIEEFHRVADKVVHIVEDEDLTYHAYHNLGARTGAIALMGTLNIKGGMEAAFGILDEKTGKFGFKVRLLMSVLPKYGAHAQQHLPRLKELAPGGRFEKPWAEMIRAIEEAEPAEALLSLEEAIEAGKK